MRVVVLTPKSPVPDLTGSRRRLLRLATAAESCHDVTLVVASRRLDPVDAAALSDLDRPRWERLELEPASPSIATRLRWPAGRDAPLQWQKIDLRAMRSSIDATLRRLRPDVVWCSSAVMAGLVLTDCPVPLVVDVAHLERAMIDSRILRAFGGRRPSGPAVRQALVAAADRQSLLRAERTGLRAATWLTTCSEVERAAARRLVDTPSTTVLNGVDLPDWLGWDATSRRLLFVGNVGYPPNAEALTLLAHQILPRLRASDDEVVLDVVGPGLAHDDPLRRSDGVVTHDVVDDLAPLYAAAGLVVAPLMSGSGTNIKVLEAFGYGVPVVTTPKGVEGLDVTVGQAVLVGSTVDELVDRCRLLLDDPDAAERQRDAARRFVDRGYGWPAIGASMLDALDRAAGS